MRISIIGHAGSGKTTLANLIAKKFSIPHIQLDDFWFEAGGVHVDQKTSENERNEIRAYVRERALKAISSESWVSDGFYPRIQTEIAQKADVLVYLDVPLWRRLLNHAQRILKPSSRNLKLKIWHELSFFREIVRRNYANKTKHMKFLSDNQDKVVVLHSRAQIKVFLETLH